MQPDIRMDVSCSEVRAVELLRASDLSLEEIAGRLGLSSAAYLRRLVKQRTGKTPGQVRAEREGEIIL